jgi:hypothetical protein
MDTRDYWNRVDQKKGDVLQKVQSLSYTGGIRFSDLLYRMATKIILLYISKVGNYILSIFTTKM